MGRSASEASVRSGRGAKSQGGRSNCSSVDYAPPMEKREPTPKNLERGPGQTTGYGVDEPGPGDQTLGHRGQWPHYKSTYWDLGRDHTLAPVMQHRPASEWGTPARHHFLSMPVFHPRSYQGQRTLLPDEGRKECPDIWRESLPAPVKTHRTVKGEFGAHHTIVANGTFEKPVRISVGECNGQPLPKTPPIRLEGDMTKGIRGTEPHFATTQSRHGRVGFVQSEWGVPDKHHFNSMPCYPKLVHTQSVPHLPKKQEGDETRGIEGPRPHMWSTYWDMGHDRGFQHKTKRYCAQPALDLNYRFAVARDGFPGSSA